MIKCFPIVALLIWSMGAQAQTVNVEEMTRKTSEEGLGGGLDASFTLQRGNTQTMDIGGGAHLQHQRIYEEREDAPAFIKQRWLLRVNARYATTSEEAFASQAFAHARWTSMWWPRAGTEVFAQYQFNEFQRLQARVLGGVGGRFELVRTGTAQVSLGVGYMLEFEQIRADSEGNAPSGVAHRSTNFLTTRFTFLDDRLLVQNTVYIQPRIDDPSDFRALEQFELAVRITGSVALGTALTLTHDSRPPADVKSTDLSLRQTLKFTF